MGRSLAGCIALFAAVPTGAAATEGAETYNAPGQSHAVVCTRLASSSAPLRFGDGAGTGFEVLDSFAFDRGPCAPGTVRLDLHEALPSAAGPLVFHRGGNGYSDAQNVKYGELATSDLADPLPDAVPSSGGRGATCPLADEPPYRALIRSIPDEMHYKRPQDVPGGSNDGASFLHYGDPGADQGDRHDTHYGYLLWSFVNVRGGGMVRTLLAPGQLMQACDVAPVTMDSWDGAGDVNGRVTARYVRVLAGSCPLYGWTVWSHTSAGAPAVAHAEEAGGGDLTAPTPDPACPVAAPAAPPAVSTGDAAASPDGSWTLGGSVDPVGTPATYRVEYGIDPSYGDATAEAVTASSPGAVPVSAPIAGLAPSTTYHYRLVATSVHGTSYGDDRTFTTPEPPPAESPAAAVTDPAPPPPVQAASVAPAPPSLTGLHLRPSTFHRARRRGGVTTHIIYTLTRATSSRLTFERKVRGRWIRVRSAIVGDSEGARFGGWIGRRPLPPGHYRLIATVPGAPARHARFTLRRP